MIRPGEHVRIKANGEKYHGIVTSVNASTEAIDITRGPDDPNPDNYRVHMGGQTRVILTIALELS